jgi:murein DD-endopeptidase MepM/ murein hydrolase activator NlpD
MIWSRRAIVLSGAALAASITRSARADDERQTFWVSGHETQGGLILCRASAGSRGWLNGQPVRVSDGMFCFGFGRDETRSASVMVEFPDGKRETRTVTPAKRKYPVLRIADKEKYPAPPKDAQERIARDTKAVSDARATNSDSKAFAAAFDWPLRGKITGAFGAERIVDGRKQDPNYGVIIAAAEGTPVHAPADGTVRLAADLYETGNTIILDHGHGVSTAYLHLSKMKCEAGDDVGHGDILGEVGQTGRTSTPHLDWRLNWFQTRLDAALLPEGPLLADKV